MNELPIISKSDCRTLAKIALGLTLILSKPSFGPWTSARSRLYLPVYIAKLTRAWFCPPGPGGIPLKTE